MPFDFEELPSGFKESEPIFARDPLSGQFGDVSGYFPPEKLGRDALLNECPQSPEPASDCLDPEQVLMRREAIYDLTLPTAVREEHIETLSIHGIECFELSAGKSKRRKSKRSSKP